MKKLGETERERERERQREIHNLRHNTDKMGENGECKKEL
jgi:hypothetical protein